MPIDRLLLAHRAGLFTRPASPKVQMFAFENRTETVCSDCGRCVARYTYKCGADMIARLNSVALFN